jgi:hypothetical protein
MNSQNPWSLNLDSFGTPPLDIASVGEHREYYMGEDGGFPRVRAVVSQVSLCCPWLVPTPKVIQNEDYPTCRWF